jgi:hypothetical protein
MPHCPTCDQRAEEKVHFCDSTELAAGPAVRICHNTDGAFIHVLDDGDADE